MGGAHIGHSLRALSQRRGTSVVMIHGNRKRTGNELYERVGALSAGLRSLGVTHGDRVALAGLNSDGYFEWLLAVPCAGAIVAPLNHRWVSSCCSLFSVLCFLVVCFHLQCMSSNSCERSAFEVRY
jgi:acyl-CoA synthetase (AMP-forming)/AMP-acid ligase II